MSKSIIITISDAEYDALRAAASASSTTPEEVASAVVAARFDRAGDEWKRFDEALLAQLRNQGLLIEPSNVPLPPKLAEIPPAGTTQRAQFEERLADELSDALEASGKTILDLIER